MPLGLTSCPWWLGRILGHDLWAPIGPGILIHVDLGGPVDCGVVLFGHQQLSCSAVKRVAKAVAIEVNENPAVGAADVLVGEDHLVDAVVVPLVMGRHLINPLGDAAVGIT